MLQITIKPIELWDESNEQFIHTKKHNLQLEHSLVSISKWEAKYHRAFLNKTNKTDEEILDYIRFMTITQNVDPEVYNYLSEENIKEINEYIDNPMTATYFPNNTTGKTNRETITSELIYYWMLSFNIPFECQRWHLNRLLTLIRVCNVKNQSPRTRNPREIMKSNAELNAMRRKKWNSKG